MLVLALLPGSVVAAGYSHCLAPGAGGARRMRRELSALTALAAVGTPPSLAGSCEAMPVAAAAHARALGCGSPQPRLGMLGWAMAPRPPAPLAQRPLVPAGLTFLQPRARGRAKRSRGGDGARARLLGAAGGARWEWAAVLPPSPVPGGRT